VILNQEDIVLLDLSVVLFLGETFQLCSIINRIYEG